MRWAALASGGGSILEAMYARRMFPDLFIADEPCGALNTALQLGIPALLLPKRGKLVNREANAERVSYTLDVLEAAQAHHIELGVMSGFMTVLSPELFIPYKARWINTHPALLPSFRGPHAVRDALRAGVQVTGTTQHIATGTMDVGPILMQEAVPVLPDDDEDTLQERIKTVERVNYPNIVHDILTGALDLDQKYQQWLTAQQA